MRLLFCLAFFVLCNVSPSGATSGINIVFVPTYAGQPIVLEEQYYPLPGGDSVMFETFKCYISNVVFYNDSEKVATENNSYHLFDASNKEAMNFVVHVSDSEPFNYIGFDMGIDSATSTSGALGGDLDPAKGMFWTWQSGYINCKIEGRSNLCKTRHNEFQLHLGGYASPDNCLQQIKLPVNGGNEIVIQIPLDKFISQIDLRKQNAIMSPGQDAVNVARKLAAIFEVKN